MFVRETGSPSAPAILFLHGNGASGGMWWEHCEHFGDYRCIAPDMPGFGRSHDEPWLSLEDTADRLAELIATQTSAGRAHVVGLSLGGATALTLLSRHPQRVDHAIVDGAGVKVGSVAALRLGIRMVAPLLRFEPVVRVIAGSLGIPAAGYAAFREDLQAASPDAFSRSFGQALSLPLPANLSQLNHPTLLVAGGRELHSTHEGMRRVAEALPHAVAMVVPGYGHGWVGAAPALHCRMVRAWITDAALPPELQPLSPRLEGVPVQSF